MSAAGAAACGAGGVAPFDISASPAAATGSRSGAGSSLVTSNSVAIVVTGGLAPVSYYSWTRLTADQGIAISNASGSNVSWSKTMSGDADITETWRCTAADALGSTDSVDVIVELTSSTGA